MKKTKILLAAMALLLILVAAAIILYVNYFAPEVHILKMDFETADKMAFNTDRDALHFGKAYPGSQVTSDINLTNNYNYPVSVAIMVSGDIAKFISVSDNNFILDEGQMKQVTYYLKTEPDTPYSNFSGETRVIIKRKK